MWIVLFRHVKIECSGTQSGGPCTGAASIQLAYSPWKFNSSIRSRMDTNRQDASRLQSAFQDRSVESMCAATILLEECVEEICDRAPTELSVLEAGSALFYVLIELVHEETNMYLPAKQLLSTCIEGLGR